MLYFYPRISPDGTRIALDVKLGEDDIWIWDVTRATMTRLTFDAGEDEFPVWTPDGQRVAFASQRDGVGLHNLYWKAADGTGAVERLIESTSDQRPLAFSPDGTRLVYRDNSPERGVRLGVLSMNGERHAELLLATEFRERNGDLSPDGRWLAYGSDASGQLEIYVRPFPDTDGGRWQVSTGGGVKPLWGPTGRELFYLNPVGTLMGVPVETDPSLSLGNAEVVVEGAYFTRGAGRTYDISPDGQRFLMIREGGASGSNAEDPFAGLTQIHVVQNWSEELKERVPTP